MHFYYQENLNAPVAQSKVLLPNESHVDIDKSISIASLNLLPSSYQVLGEKLRYLKEEIRFENYWSLQDLLDQEREGIIFDLLLIQFQGDYVQLISDIKQIFNGTRIKNIIVIHEKEDLILFESLQGMGVKENLLEEDLLSSLGVRTLFKLIQEDKKSLPLIQTALQEINLRNKMEDQVGLACHELRNPLQGIKSSLASFQLFGSLNEHQEMSLKIAQKSCERLEKIIEDYLDLAKLSRGMEMHWESIELHELIDEVVKSFSQEARSKNLHLQLIDLNELFIKGDREKLRRVLVNLISNALKYARHKVFVQMEILEKEVRISVIDDGPGLLATEQDKVFERFVRSESHSNSKVKGTGLGLSIAKEIVELHHGKISLDSSPGFGANFFFTLPY